MQTFKRAAVFADIHFGNKGNSRQFNEDCDRYVDWFVEHAQTQNCDTCIFLGDWHHQRATLNITTLQHSLKNLEKISAAFEQNYFIVGNHDLYYKDSRTVNSIEFAKHIKNLKFL